MPEIKIADITKQLKADMPSRLYLIRGKDAYIKRKAAQMLIDYLTPDILPEFNVERFDMQRAQLPAVIESVNQYPQMAARRCVVAENFDLPQSAEQCDEFLRHLRDIPDTSVLILWTGAQEPSGVQMKKLADTCAKIGSVLTAEPMGRQEIKALLLEKAQESGAKLKPQEAEYMIERCGADSLLLLSQLDKLIAYCGKKQITQQVIDELTPATLEANAFKIAQCILRGRKDEAFRILGNLLAAKEEPLSIYARLTGNFVDLYRAKAAVLSNISTGELAQGFPNDYGGKKEFRLQNAMRDCGGYSLSLLREYVNLLLDAEIEMKSTGTDKRICLEKLVTRLCRAKRTTR